MSVPAPDPTPSVALAAWRELVATKSAELITAGVHTTTDPDWGVWVFRGRPEYSIDGTNKCSVVIAQRRGWTTPNRHNTARFPQLQVEVFADLTRDAVSAPDRRTAEDRAMDVFHVLDTVFHRPGERGMSWGNGDGRLFVISSARSTEPRVEDVPETDGNVRLTADYDIELA